MKVLLLKDIENLGDEGDIVTVKNGYGRNFLIPARLAVIALPSVVRHHEEIRRQRARKTARVLEDAEKMKEQLEAVKVVTAAKIGKDDRIFGTITPQQIAQGLTGQGFGIDRKHIEIDEDIRMLGVYTATVKLHKGVTATLKIEVVPESEEAT